MKKILIVFFIVSGYLYLSYAYFYNFLGQKHLVAPAHPTTALIGNNPTNYTIEYLALGDSLTTGVGASDYKNSYPYLIAQKLSTKNNVRLVNLAQAGDSSLDLVYHQLPKATTMEPDLITLLIGVNDIHNLVSLKRFDLNYRQIVATLKQTRAKIYLLSIPYLGSEKIVFPPYNLLLDWRTRQFNQIIKKVSTDLGVSYIDIYSLTQPAGFYSTDEFHPADYGYQQWVKEMNVN